jgi:hypothetical protein
MRTYLKTLLLALTVSAASAPASAECYDVFGCTDQNFFNVQDLLSGPNCDFLYTMRNQIYKEHGYCFHTAHAISVFGNAGCVTGDANRLGLNRYELANAATILKAENMKGCPQW